MSVPRVDAPQSERRKIVRTRLLLRGLVCDLTGSSSFTCAIRELTQRGARIAIPDGRTLAPEICLINVREKVAHDAILLWHNHVDAGFALLNIIPLSALGDARVRRLYGLCVGATDGAGLDES
jgi:hypothetical protein